MSNAMRRGKRTLAGVAAGALTAGLIPFAVVATGTAANAATGTATVSPVRATVTGTTADNTPYGKASFKLAMDDTVTVDLTSAPGNSFLTFQGDGNTFGNTDDTVTLNQNATGLKVFAASVTDDTYLNVKASTAGTYTGLIFDGTDTASFTFTTTGKPATMTLTPTTSDIAVGGNVTFKVELKDADGKLTQPVVGDLVTMTSVPSANTSFGDVELDSTDLRLGASDDTFSPTVAGTFTVSATPSGTLPSLGVTTQQATVNASGSVSTNPVVNMAVSAPANAWNKAAQPVTGEVAQVPAGTSSVTITIDDTTANAVGSTIRFRARTVTAGTVNGILYPAYAYVNVTTDANRKATATFDLAGNSVLSGNDLVVEQVNAANGTVSNGGKITVTQTPANNFEIIATPDDSVVAKLGDSVSVSLLVQDDTFEIPQAGWTVTAGRGTSAPGVLLSSGTTGADGKVTLQVSGAAGITTGTVESYSFVASLAGSSTGTTGNNALQVTYTTSGLVDSLVYQQGAGSPASSDIASTTTVTKGALVRIPGVEAKGVLTGGPTTQGFTIATGVDDTTVAASIGYYTTLKASTSPANAATYTAPEGVFITDDTTTATWSNGKSTFTASNGQMVYVYGTKTGTHDITIASGGQTLTAKVKIVNSAKDAYNIALTPAEQALTAGGIGTATLTVTDLFGNPVKTAGNDGLVTVRASGEVLLAGFSTSDDFNTDAAGQATVTVIAGNAAGTGTLAAGPATANTAPAWVNVPTPYVPPTGAPAPVSSAAATVTVTSTPVEPTISIVGERGIVRDRPGIIVDGLTTGFDEGAILKPWVKFPGETMYTEGVRQILVDQDGEFMWQRRTGKKIYIIIKSEDGSVRSNRIIIPAQ